MKFGAKDLRSIRYARFGGKISALAEGIGAAPRYMSRCLSVKPKARKNIGEAFARDIEKKLGLPRLALDQRGFVQRAHPQFAIKQVDLAQPSWRIGRAVFVGFTV
jgi:hypothetical protein